ncbi:nuclear transport factor 2 family protein [Erythrobacter sp. YT30]|uniref:nuclear transport factor 2 family protein n=1 Tax=Erythrobacter sp. YT30 TaxID=1735012 RepID=UPI00076C11CB|nr:nuclear transport factor 2 family protein [Erythrobacter sp. YT30]KWV92633.1 ketosteroid isomerase [Erythrobacter sp. YT30]
MSIEQLAKDFTQAVKEDDAEKYQSFWSDDIISLEPTDDEMARVQGREALLAKHKWWEENAEMHSSTTEGPYVFGDQFAVNYGMDVTMFGERSQMKEVGVYTVADGKIVEERFFYGSE